MKATVLFLSLSLPAVIAFTSPAQTVSQFVGGTNWAEVVPGPTIVLPEPEAARPQPTSASNLVSSAREKLALSDFRKALRPTANGAIADHGLLRVEFSADAAAARPIVITTADGRTLACRATFLVWTDASEQTALAAEVVSSLGSIVSPTEVIYENAWDAIKAHLRYEATGNTLVQDIILEESPALPAGLDPETARLEVWTQ